MHVRTSPTLMIFPREDHIIVLDYASQRALEAPSEVMHWIQTFDTGCELEDVLEKQPGDERQAARSTIEQLLQSRVLLEYAESATELGRNFEDSWKWGPLAAAFHFSTLNLEFASLAESQESSAAKLSCVPQPDLDWHRNFEHCSTLLLPAPANGNALLATMVQRRSNRNPREQSITLPDLADCLFAGLAITGHVQTAHGFLPLSLTPSGGARNPYEAFVLVQNVNGVTPGFYHYSALKHQLRQVSTQLPNNPAALLGGQDWATNMPAIIFLVAVLERTMWKYEEASAYKVVMIESGHIGQNIMLAATSKGLSACPTAALAHQTISSYLGLTEITHTPVYAISLCQPGDYDSEIVPNTMLPGESYALSQVN